ncbi:hypothetical protein [Pseudooceanicola sp. MF1-13]|uniref:hypothetical protein n=1 Tax=Pseudooceanicola sp. MF1-13 TaxID=3379095 RepID=UPI0038919BA7
MLDWIQNNSTLITASVQLVTAAVWVVYLHIFIVSFRRQKRSNILINRIAGNHDRAHILVGNMGAEPIYVSAVIVDVTVAGEQHTAVVTEDLFDEDNAEEDPSARSLSNQGPLKSAETRDIGALGDLIDRAMAAAGIDAHAKDLEDVKVTITADGTYDHLLVAASQSYGVYHGQDRRRFLPKDSQTRQIRSRRARQSLSAKLDAALRREAEAVRQGGDGRVRSAA